MIHPEQIEELLNLPVDERCWLLRLLQESLHVESERQSEVTTGDQASPAAKWLLSMSGRYSGPTDTARRADEILSAEINNQSGLTFEFRCE